MNPPFTRHFHLRTLSAGCALFAGMLAATASAQNLTTLVGDAKIYDASVQSAKIAWDAAKLRVDQSRSGLQPSAALSAGVSRQNSDIYPGSIDRSTARQGVTVSGSYPLWRPAAKVTVSQAERGEESARIALDAAEQDLIVRVSAAYFDVLAAIDTMAFVKAQKAAVAEQLAAAKRNFEVGTSTITDSREAQARFDLVGAQEIAADNDLRVKRSNLDQLVGKANLSPKGLIDKVALPAPMPNDVSAWLAASQDNHPAIRQSRVALDVAKLETEKARLADGPTVDLTGSYDLSFNKGSTGTSGTPRSHTYGVGVSLNMPLWTGGSIQNRLKETLVLEDKARSDLEAARRGVATGTRSAYFGVVSGLGQVKALEAAEVSSQSALDANKLGYQVGVRINIDVLNSQSQLFQTKRDLAKARYEVIVGGLRLRQANGTLQMADVETVNTLLVR